MYANIKYLSDDKAYTKGNIKFCSVSFRSMKGFDYVFSY